MKFAKIVQINIKKYLITVNHEYETFKLTLHAFLCEAKNEKIILTEHLDSKWLTKEELEHLDWAAADIPIIKILKEA